MKDTALEIVLKQIEAYNNKDIDGLLSFYSDSLEVIFLPENEVAMSGKKSLGDHLRNDFPKHSSLNVEVLETSQETLDDDSIFLTVKEKKTTDKGVCHLLALYNVKGNKIRRVWISALK